MSTPKLTVCLKKGFLSFCNFYVFAKNDLTKCNKYPIFLKYEDDVIAQTKFLEYARSYLYLYPCFGGCRLNTTIKWFFVFNRRQPFWVSRLFHSQITWNLNKVPRGSCIHLSELPIYIRRMLYE